MVQLSVGIYLPCFLTYPVILYPVELCMENKGVRIPQFLILFSSADFSFLVLINYYLCYIDKLFSSFYSLCV